MKDVVILGAGLSGISTALFLQDKKWVNTITILEKDEAPGGLCKSLKVGKYTYDIGPHILFSKDKDMLSVLIDSLEEENRLIRSNQIIYRGRYIQYPFENDLSKLPKEDLEYCINTFNNNPYEDYDSDNMLQFFLKTFGEGITNIYLRPYNEKIWKYDPSFMSTSMVDRIPKPTKEEIQRSANGETVDGYVHQLNFSYPSKGGIEAVVNGLINRLDKNKCEIETKFDVVEINKSKNEFNVVNQNGKIKRADLLISTIPIQELTNAYTCVTEDVKMNVNRLEYNSIMIAFVRIPYDLCGNNFTFTIPDKKIIFHRISKMDFLGKNYHFGDESTYMVEITYRKNDSFDLMSEKQIKERIVDGIIEINFARKREDVEVLALSKHQYAYVIYNLFHNRCMEKIRDYYLSEGVILNGRFGNFEYWNMDRILRESMKLSESLDCQ